MEHTFLDSKRPSFLDINRLLDYRLVERGGQSRSRRGWKGEGRKGEKSTGGKKLQEINEKM